MADEKQKFILNRFGKYLLLDHLIDGGMAKICRARFLDASASKVVVIKMIQSKYNEDENFIRMFMDEVKVSFGLIHPNIAQTYDTGIVDGQAYTVMEYVDGKNLKQFLDRLREKKFVFPVDVSIFIISQVCQGLSYAHNFTDQLSGKKINIIHRDISPHNIMITYDGAVKVIDFGIAKAETNSESTQAGTIKGKFSYLAPEYIEGLELDHRYDQFAVGITLWELLCCRKLFKANTDIGIIKEVQKCKIAPPSSINPNVDKELDEIVLKALSKDRNLRYENMEQFNRALVKYLYSHFPEFNASDISYFAQELFADDIKQDRQKLYEFGKIDISKYIDDMKSGAENSSQPPAAAPTADPNATETFVNREDKKAQAELDLGMEDLEVPEGTIQLDTGGAGDKTNLSQRLSVGQTGISHVKIERQGSGPLLKSKGGGKEAGEKIVKANPRPQGGTVIKKIKKSGTQVARVKKVKKAPKKQSSSLGGVIGFMLVLGIAGAGFFLKDHPMVKGLIGQVMGVEETGKSKEEKGGPREPANVEPQTGKLVLQGLATFQVVHINGQKTTYKGLGIDLPLNQEHTLRVTEDGKEPFVLKFQLSSDKPKLVQRVPELKFVPYGELYGGDTYADGTILSIEIQGERVEKTLPIRGSFRLPAGSYRAEVSNDLMGIKKSLTINVEKNKRVMIPE